MSKMPALSRSFHKVSLNVFCRELALAAEAVSLKSAAARRTFSTPKPVPVRIQSVCAHVAGNNRANARMIERREIIFIREGASFLVIEPELDFNLASRIPRRQGPEGINA